MELRQLKYVVRVSHTLHFGKAAELEHIAPSVLSTQIRRLETELGVQLFHRGSQQVSLTAAGKHFVEHSEQILGSLTRMRLETLDIASSGTSRLRIGFFGEAAGELTHLMFSAFAELFPDTKLSVVELNMSNQFDHLVSGNIDVAMLRLPIGDPSLVAVPLFLIGAALSTIEPYSVPPEGMMSLFFGDSIVTALIGQVTHGAVWFMTDPVVNLNVLGLGAWFALLFTGLNLIPAGQLDGGHIAYALLGPRAKYVSYACIVVLLALALLVSNVLMLWAVMLFLFGRAHPPVLDETVPLQRPQYALIAVGVLLLIVSFAPNPMTFVGG